MVFYGIKLRCHVSKNIKCSSALKSCVDWFWQYTEKKQVQYNPCNLVILFKSLSCCIQDKATTKTTKIAKKKSQKMTFKCALYRDSTVAITLCLGIFSESCFYKDSLKAATEHFSSIKLLLHWEGKTNDEISWVGDNEPVKLAKLR